METPTKLRIDYLKNGDYRTIHVDGANGGLTPELNIFMAFWLQRGAMPDATIHDVVPALGFNAAPAQTLARAQLVREIEFGTVMSVEVAKQIHQWLGDRIGDVEKAREQIRQAESGGVKQ